MSRSVIVTAGAAGIGLAIAVLFAERGDRVTICDVDDAALARAKARIPALTVVQADVAGSKIQPVEIAEMAWFLASDAGRHITGQIVGVDGNAEWEG